jgi:hypothetical protein
MDNLQEPANRVILNALTNPNYAKELLANPAEVFRRDADVEISEADDEKFRNYFHEIAAPEILGEIATRSRSEEMLHQDEITLEASISCTACRAIGYTVVAGAILLGAAAVTALTVESALVVQVVRLCARFGLAVTDAAALQFLKSSIVPMLASGTNAVSTEVCRYVGAC